MKLLKLLVNITVAEWIEICIGRVENCGKTKITKQQNFQLEKIESVNLQMTFKNFLK